MSRQAEFSFSGQSVMAELKKVDRKKIYGWSSIEVYVKISKGTKMVRKFMVWKTNKEATGEYPAYVFHYTDFSAGRAEMLKKEIKVSDSKKQIEEIFASELLENVKKGWEKA